MIFLSVIMMCGVLQDVMVNGTYSSDPADHRMKIVRDVTQLPREQNWQQDEREYLWQPQGDKAELSDVACDEKALRSIVIRSRNDHKEGEASAYFTLNVPQPEEPPQFKKCSRMLLFYHAGLSEKTEGTQFIVYVNKSIIAVDTVSRPSWRLCCADLTPWAGKSISLELCVANAPAWAAFGHPVVVDLWGPYQAYPGGLAGATSGGTFITYDKAGGSRAFPNKPLLALAQVDAFTLATLAISLNAQSWEEWNQIRPEPYLLSTGTHLLPMMHEHPTLFGFNVLSGDAHVRNLDLVPLAPDFPQPK